MKSNKLLSICLSMCGKSIVLLVWSVLGPLTNLRNSRSWNESLMVFILGSVLLRKDEDIRMLVNENDFWVPAILSLHNFNRQFLSILLPHKALLFLLNPSKVTQDLLHCSHLLGFDFFQSILTWKIKAISNGFNTFLLPTETRKGK